MFGGINVFQSNTCKGVLVKLAYKLVYRGPFAAMPTYHTGVFVLPDGINLEHVNLNQHIPHKPYQKVELVEVLRAD